MPSWIGQLCEKKKFAVDAAQPLKQHFREQEVIA